MPSQKTNRSQLNRARFNRATRTHIKTRIAKARAAIEQQDLTKDQKKAVIGEAHQALDRAARKGVIHRNTAARKKSRLMFAQKAAAAENS